MSEPSTVQILLFLDSGICAVSGGLFLTGWYGFPASPALGIAFYILAAMFAAIFVTLVGEPDQGYDGPPEQATGNRSQQ